MKKTGILLINLGTPDSPTPPDVKKYLQEFLMDPLVIDIPSVFRFLLVYGIITPRRSHTSAEAYQQIWTDRGSPLLFHTEDLCAGVKNELGDSFQVEFAMRYGSPSIQKGLESLSTCDEIFAIPLYPQYSLAASESSIIATNKAAMKLGLLEKVSFIGAFYDEAFFLDSFESVIRKHWDPSEFLLFSYHGLPEHQISKIPANQSTCFKNTNCCDQPSEATATCYRRQCFETTGSIASKLNLKESQYITSFQSRLGRRPWIKPYTDELLPEIAKRGFKKISVVCPSFVADCLETLEEIQIRAKDDWLNLGGEDLKLIPCLNSEPAWVSALSGKIKSLHKI